MPPYHQILTTPLLPTTALSTDAYIRTTAKGFAFCCQTSRRILNSVTPTGAPNAVHSVHLMNACIHQMQTVRKLLLILPSHGGWKAVSTYRDCRTGAQPVPKSRCKSSLLAHLTGADLGGDYLETFRTPRFLTRPEDDSNPSLVRPTNPSYPIKTLLISCSTLVRDPNPDES